MVIKIPVSNSQRLIFPYLDLSNCFAYSHYNPELTKYRLSMDTLDNFFVSIHKYTAVDFERITMTQKLITFAFPPLFIILVVFGTLLGVYYKGNTEPFIVRFSAGIILASSGLFLIWLAYILFKLRNLKKNLVGKINNVIEETNLSFAKARVRWVLPKLDFPHWIELWFEKTSDFGTASHSPESVKTNTPLITKDPQRKYLTSTAGGKEPHSYRADNFDISNQMSPEKVGLIVD